MERELDRKRLASHLKYTLLEIMHNPLEEKL